MKTEIVPTPMPATTGALCPRCGDTGKPVKQITLQSLLKPDALSRAGSGPYRFCPSERCAVVYFSAADGPVFTKDDLTVRIGIKEIRPPRHVCYCFDHTVEEIEEEVRLTGRTTVLDDIKTRMKEACWCETKSPLGSCCLSTVTKYVKAAETRYGKREGAATVAEKSEDSCATHEAGDDATARKAASLVTLRVSRSEKIAWIGSVGSAMVASACCWLPLLLLAFGVSGVAVSATFEKYRPLFATLTFGFLAAAFYFAYRPRPKTVSDVGGSPATGDACCVAPATQGECCPPNQAGKWSLQKFNRAMLWVVAAVALAFVFFPNYVGALLGGRQSAGFSPDFAQFIISVEGMDCAGSATSLEKELTKIPGVGAARVSYEKKEAVIGVPKGTPAPRAQVLSAIATAGFTGHFQETETRTLSIVGMTCEACAAHVQSALAKVPGVRSAEVNFERQTAVVLGDDTLAEDKLAKAIESAGYKVAPASTPTAAPANEREDQ